MTAPPSSDMSLHVDVCVCAYRRAQIADTLRSLSQLVLPAHVHMRVIVADNDETPQAQAFIEAQAQASGLEGFYLHAPAQNISVARNACLEAATAPFVAFLDDDECATPRWLFALLEEIQKGHSDIVLGPVQAIYAPECPRWIRAGDFHSTRPVWVKDKIVTGYTCNVLFSREHPSLRDMRFRLDLGQTGGEDTAFFAAASRAGARIGYAARAIVTEIVPPERACWTWLAKRKFRAGQTHGALLLEEKGGRIAQRLTQSLIAAAKALFCVLGAIPALTNPPRRAFWILRAIMHVGVVCRLFGRREIALYGPEG